MLLEFLSREVDRKTFHRHCESNSQLSDRQQKQHASNRFNIHRRDDESLKMVRLTHLTFDP